MPTEKPGEIPRFGKASRGMSREFAEGLRAHKQALFDAFQKLIPALAEAFPDWTIVVRPHPTENQEAYRRIAAKCKRVQVTNDGSVVPWLLAAKVLVHNGCTTGVEAYVMRVPAVAYHPSVNEYYDNGFYRLPNLLSYRCFNFEELRVTLEKILAGECGAADGDERQLNIDRYLAAQEGKLACERIVDVLEEMMDRFLCIIQTRFVRSPGGLVYCQWPSPGKGDHVAPPQQPQSSRVSTASLPGYIP